MLSIQVIFITYFVQLKDLLKLNEEMFFWIFVNKEAIEESIERIARKKNYINRFWWFRKIYTSKAVRK